MNFEGEFSQLSERQIEFISEVLEKQGFAGAKVNFEAVGEAGDNYIANVKRITAEKDGQKLQIIAKTALTDDRAREASNTQAVFQSEHTVYTKILPKFSNIEKAEGIPHSERFRYATCFGTLMVDKQELILLEDLQVPGFQVLDRFSPLPDAAVRLVLRSFAKYHALSYVLKTKEPETFNKFKNAMCDPWKSIFQFPNIAMFFTVIENDSVDLLENPKYKEAVTGSVSKMPELYKKMEECESESRFSVIKQGDPWINNLMFRLEDGTPVECCMVDYQLAYLGSPAGDLHYMIFNCTDYALRKKHFYDWLDYYYSELENYLSEFGLKANFVYPREQLDADMKRRGKMSLAQSLLLSSVLFRQKADAEKIKSSMEQPGSNMAQEAIRVKNMDDKSKEEFKTRVEGLVDSLLDFGYM